MSFLDSCKNGVGCPVEGTFGVIKEHTWPEENVSQGIYNSGTIYPHSFNDALDTISRSRSLCCRPPVCRLSVTFVRPTQAVVIFYNISTPFGTLAILQHPRKISRRSSQGNPSVGGGGNARGVAKYDDFGPIEGYIWETVQNRR